MTRTYRLGPHELDPMCRALADTGRLPEYIASLLRQGVGGLAEARATCDRIKLRGPAAWALWALERMYDGHVKPGADADLREQIGRAHV